MTSKRFLTPPEAATHTGLSAQYLKKLRHSGGGPSYAKVGPRRIVYDIEDLNSWLDSRKVRSTSEAHARHAEAVGV